MLQLIRTTLMVLITLLALAAQAPNAEGQVPRENDLSNYKELIGSKLDAAKESAQHNIDMLRERIEVQQKVLDIQTSRINDLTIYLGAFAILLAVLAIIAGWIGYVSVRNRAKEEARIAANEWFAREGQPRIEALLTDFEKHLDSQKTIVDVAAQKQIDALQKTIQTAPDRVEEVAQSVSTETDPLQKLVEQLKQKPESDYAFADWNARAFDAYRQGSYAVAGEYWLRSANARNPTRNEVATSMLNAAVSLGADGKNERALELYEQLQGRFGTATEPPLREQVAKALINKGITLGKMGRSGEEILCYDDVLARFGTATETPLREQVAKALINKGVALGKMGRSDEEILCYDDVLARFGTATETPLREQVAKALANKGITLGKMGRSDEAILCYDDVLARLGTATEIPLREIVGGVENNKGFALLTSAKESWGDIAIRTSLLQSALSYFELSLPKRVDLSMVKGNKAYALFLLGRIDEAREVLGQALTEGGEEMRDAELKDTEIFTVPEDEGFRTLIGDVWSSIKARQPA